jgi:hypothetical protein
MEADRGQKLAQVPVFLSSRVGSGLGSDLILHPDTWVDSHYTA